MNAFRWVDLGEEKAETRYSILPPGELREVVPQVLSALREKLVEVGEGRAAMREEIARGDADVGSKSMMT